MKLDRKRKTKDPCLECFLHKNLCICSIIPSLQTRTKVVLIIHAKELKRTTNTGRLALKALQNSEMRVRGQSQEPVDLSDLLNDCYQSFLFYPSEDATELTTDFLAKFSKPIQLIVPDGNWRQASKVQSRHQELKNVPRVMISKKNIAIQHLRAESFAEGMSTLEAIAEALKVIEGEEVYQELIKVYKAKLENTLKGRGQLI
jgi:DTW domain-containing protein YfiP